MREVKNEWKRILRDIDDLGRHVARVGWMDPDSATIAYINDRGSADGRLPARPVLSPGTDAARADVLRVQATGLRQVLRGASNVGRAVAEEVGAIAEQAVRDAIDAVQPPNAPSTVARKHGYAAPLRGFSPDRIWQGLTHDVVSPAEAAAEDEDGGD